MGLGGFHVLLGGTFVVFGLHTLNVKT